MSNFCMQVGTTVLPLIQSRAVITTYPNFNTQEIKENREISAAVIA